MNIFILLILKKEVNEIGVKHMYLSVDTVVVKRWK